MRGLKRFTKFSLNFLVLVCMFFILSSCKKRVEPTYEDNKTMQIGAWVAPNIQKDENGDYKYITESHYQDIADSGINVIYALYEAFDFNATMEALDMAEAAGIGYYVRDSSIGSLFQDVFDAQGEPIQDDVDADFELFKNRVAAYKDHPAFKGHLIFDEPGAALYDWLGLYHQYYKEYLPDKDFYVNLLPTYSSIDQRDDRTYGEYIDEYINKVNPEFLSYDHYPLMLFYEEPVLTDDYLFNLELIAEKTKEADIPFWLFIQTIGYTTISGTQTRRPEEDDIRWQVAVSMAYGVQGIQHFCYWTPGGNGNESFTTAMIDREGNKTDLYEAASKVNHEVLNYDHVYLDFTWEGTMTVPKGEENVNFRMLANNLSEHERVKDVDVEEDAIIGTFKDSKGNDGFMVVNYTDPALDKSNKVTITFKDAKKAIVYEKGFKKVIDLKRGKLTLNLESGEGRFVIPF